MITAVEVAPQAGYRIWLRYADGVSGEVDLFDLAGRGIFRAWLDRSILREGPRIAVRVDCVERRSRALRGCALSAPYRQIGRGGDARCASGEGPCLSCAGSSGSSFGCSVETTRRRTSMPCTVTLARASTSKDWS